MSKKKLLIATTNAKKVDEFKALFADLPLELVYLKSIPGYEEVEETGESFEENASLKALGYARQSGLLTLGEDSGLCCDALEGAPGVYSGRFAGPGKSDEDNNQKLLKWMEKMPDNCRSAHYTSAIAIAEPGKLIGVVTGEVHGSIARQPAGTGGFGYDPLFFYLPYQKTFGEVSPDMKHRVSHRAKAMEKALQVLKKHFADFEQ